MQEADRKKKSLENCYPIFVCGRGGAEWVTMCGDHQARVVAKRAWCGFVYVTLQMIYVKKINHK